jgi:formyl-CoA transferase
MSQEQCGPGEHDPGQRRALDGVRVLDLTHQVAGPSATLMLAYLGAEVVKVIAPGSRDSYDAIAFYLNNASKKSIELDLKSGQGVATARELAKRADIFVENFSPGVIERLGLGWDVLSGLNPRLIYAQVKGFAADSPWGAFPCFDPIAQGFAGASGITGEPDGLPMKPGPDVGDTGTGMVLVGGILAALYQRERDGRGQRVEIAMTDQVATFMRIHFGWPIERRMDTPRFGNRPPFLVTTAPSDIYPCPPFGPSDYVHIHCGSDRQWERMATLMNREDLLGDERFATMVSRGEHKAEVDAAVRGWTATLDKIAAMKALGDAGVPAGALRSTTEVLADEDMRERGIFVTVDDPGRGPVTLPGYPVRMSRSPARVTPPPQPGQHTAEVLRDWLGEGRPGEGRPGEGRPGEEQATTKGQVIRNAPRPPASSRP